MCREVCDMCSGCDTKWCKLIGQNWREHEYDATPLGAAEHDAMRAPEIVYSA